MKSDTIECGLVAPDKRLLLQITPKLAGLDFESMARENGERIRELLLRHGAILFRDFGVDSPERFEAAVRSLSTDLPTFQGESSPRSRVLGSVFTSTDYPSDYPIQFHNEYSYAREWPMNLFFWCQIPAKAGGATPISDSRSVLLRLKPGTLEKFRRLGVKYVRNFVPGIGVSWEKAFGTKDRRAVEETLLQEGLNFEWLGREGLRTSHVGPAVRRHPLTGEEVWFNHAFFFNVRSLEPEDIREAMLLEDERDLSTQTYYGDGTPIEPEMIEEIRAAFAAESETFKWRRGDVLLIDNMLAAHARAAFEGQRRILVVMTNRCSLKD